MKSTPSSNTIGIVGAGIGGLVAAIALRRAGHEVQVFEQARQFARVGADINLTPNAVRALDGLGVGGAARVTAARPTHRISRSYDSGEETSRLEMADSAEQRYGAPQLTIHRADLLAALTDMFPADRVSLGKRAERIVAGQQGVDLHFADGEPMRVAALIGADGIHSAVRTAIANARHSFYILGWDINSEVKLCPDGAGDGLPDPLGRFLNAVVKLWKKSVVDWKTFLIFLLVFAGSVFLNISPVLYVLAAALAGIVVKELEARKA